VAQNVKDFMEANEDSVILFDGLEYLMVHNDFEKVLKLVHALNEYTAINNTRLLIPLNPYTLEKDKLAFLKRDLKVVGRGA
jgi:archaellum biogenesis ATPase FlaH